jgi:hypothetical protein
MATRERADVPAQRPVHLDVKPSWGQQLADALVLVADTALHHGMDPGPAGERYQVVIHVDAPVLADADAPGQSVMEHGTHVSAETSQRLACDATRVGSPRSVRGRARFRPRCGARSSIATRAVASRAVGYRSVRAITSGIGHAAGQPRCRISRCCVGGTIARSTSMPIGSSDCRMASCASGIRTGRRCPPSHLRLACRRILSKPGPRPRDQRVASVGHRRAPAHMTRRRVVSSTAPNSTAFRLTARFIGGTIRGHQTPKSLGSRGYVEAVPQLRCRPRATRLRLQLYQDAAGGRRDAVGRATLHRARAVGDDDTNHLKHDSRARSECERGRR